jgi:hypothetical protein
VLGPPCHSVLGHNAKGNKFAPSNFKLTQSDFQSALRAEIIITSGRKEMSERESPEKSPIQILRNAFEGMKGRQPNSDQELNEWISTDEGKQATLFESTGLSRYGDEFSGGVPEIQILRDAFEGEKGHQPNSDQELSDWLATDEGKQAESSLNSRFAEGR